ncbi:MAG: L,D-transpeptidase family protein [Candidatus Omnitrophota bacterium]
MISVFLILAFLGSDVSVYAQSVLTLPAPGARVSLSHSFLPPLLKGVKVYPSDPFRFDFILDRGVGAGLVPALDKGRPQGSRLHGESNRLIKYFLAALTIPEKDLWVNLSPYEKDRIVPEAFGQTEMGRDLLAQDYILKQITASLMYPEGDVGKKFWSKVYAALQDKYGTTDIPVDTFNKVWIVPEKAEVFEKNNAAYVTRAHLKVMLETDYNAAANQNTMASVGAIHESPLQLNSSHELTKSILREIIIPILEKEVNEGADFAQLRQVYHSLILATWYKRKIINAIQDDRRGDSLGLPDGVSNPMQYYVDHNKTVGVNIVDKNEKEKIWAQYVDAFKKGVFNYIDDSVGAIHESPQQNVQNGPRQYFSGGFSLRISDNVMRIVSDLARLPAGNSQLSIVHMKANPVESNGAQGIITSVQALDILQDDPDRDPLQDDIDQAMMDGLSSPDKGRRLAARIDAVLNAEYRRSETKEYKVLLVLGAQVLRGYSMYRTREGVRDYLSPRGRSVIQLFKNMLGRIERKGFKWDADVLSECKDLMRLIPTVTRIQDDLFIDVAPFLDLSRLDLTEISSKLRFDIRVTDGCTNQCVFCMVSRDKGPVMSMPLPMAVKIQKMLRQKAAPPQFYFNTEPLDYYDPVMGADYADLVGWERRLRFSLYREVTHGLGGKLSPYTKDIIKQLPVGNFGLSFRVDHWSVINFLKEMYERGLSLESARQDERWAKLVDRHVARFMPIMEGALESGKKVSVRVYDLKSESVFEQYPKAWFVLKGMQWMSEDVLTVVKKSSLKKKMLASSRGLADGTNGVGRFEIRKPGKVLWKGDAAKLLIDLGVPADVLRALAQDNGAETILGAQETAWGVIGADGHAYFINSEEKSPSLLVRDMFPDSSSDEFELLVWFIRTFVLSSFDEVTMSTIPANWKQPIIDLLAERKSLQGFVSNNRLEDVKAGVEVVQQGYWRLWQNMFLDTDHLNLLKDSDDLQRIYEAIKDFPAPRFLRISAIHDDSRLPLRLDLDQSDESWQMDPRTPIQYFKSPLKVFDAKSAGEVKDVGSDFAQITPGRLLLTGAAVLVITAVTMFFVHRDDFLKDEDPSTLPQLEYGQSGVAAVDYGLRMLSKKFAVAKNELVLIIDPQDQKLFVLKDGRILKKYPVSTSIKGVGTQKGSNKTPDGIFRIHDKIGAGAKKGKWFINKMPDKRVPKPDEDAVLSRIMTLDGQEGHNANSLERAIYIHGTNQEQFVGTPASHGCIRMKNDEVIELFDMVKEGAFVVIVHPSKLLDGKKKDVALPQRNKDQAMNVAVEQSVSAAVMPGPDWVLPVFNARLKEQFADIKSGWIKQRALRTQIFREWAAAYRDKKVIIKQSELAKLFGISQQSVSAILGGFNVRTIGQESLSMNKLRLIRWAKKHEGTKVDVTQIVLARQFGVSQFLVMQVMNKYRITTMGHQTSDGVLQLMAWARLRRNTIVLMKQSEIAAMFGVAQNTVSVVLRSNKISTFKRSRVLKEVDMPLVFANALQLEQYPDDFLKVADAAMKAGEILAPEQIIQLSSGLFPEAQALYDYLAQFKGQSGREGQGYHSYEHGLYVSYLTYLALSAEGYSHDELLQAWIATSLHDFDKRPEMSAPRVDRTIAQIEEDLLLKEKIVDLIGENGFSAVLAIIRHTDHPWKAEQVELFNQSLDKVAEDNRESVARRAEIVQLMDKISGFVYFGPHEHYRNTQELLMEINKEMSSDQEFGKLEVGFMDELRADPLFEQVLAVLPEWSRKNWEANHDFYTQLGRGISVESALSDRAQVAGQRDDAMSLRVNNEDQVRQWIKSAVLVRLSPGGRSFQDVLEDTRPDSTLAGYVIKIPHADEEEGWLARAKRAMGGIVADFNTVSDVEVAGVKYPFVVIQKKLKVFITFRMTDIIYSVLPDGRPVDLVLLEKNLIEEMMARGIYYSDALIPMNYGLDEKTGKLYLIDYGRAQVVGRDHRLFNGFIFRPVDAKDSIRKGRSAWQSYQDRDDGKYLDDIGVADNDALYRLWGTKMDENRPVPDIELSSDKGGIDLNPERLDIKSSGEAVELNVDPAQLEAMQRADGLMPVIIDIQPLADLLQFLK